MGSLDQSGRCYFLELPVEIRVMIYEELVQPQPLSDSVIWAPTLSVYYSPVPKSASVTHINRQIRHESLFTFYRDTAIRIIATTPSQRIDAAKWAKHLAESGVLASIRQFVFKLGLRWFLEMKIDLAPSEQLQLQIKCYHASRGIGNCDSKCDDAQKYRSFAEANLRELPTDLVHRRVMTKGVMQSLVEWFCMLAQEMEDEMKLARRKRLALRD